MDTFGTGAQARGALMTAFSAARRTGRTKALIESLHTGDRVVFMDCREADRVKRLAAELGRKIETVVVPVGDPSRLFCQGTAQGRLLFDHSWLEAFYIEAIESAYRFTEAASRDLGGYDLRHVETKLAAREAGKWRWTELKKPDGGEK